MYPRFGASAHPDKPALIMAESGQVISYGELDSASAKLATYLRGEGLEAGGHFAILLNNHPKFIECCAAGERSGLYYTAINTHLTAEEIAYILDNSDSKILIAGARYLELARAALALTPSIRRCLVIDGADEGDLFRSYDSAIRNCPPIAEADERLGTAMLYSSGTTGRPKGILRPLPDVPPAQNLSVFNFFEQLLQCRNDMVFCSPAPLYHSAPNTAASVTIRSGGTLVIMDRFDPEKFLALVERYKVTHTQLVPTMFSRMLKLPDAVREGYDLGSLTFAIHAAAPCPVPVKEAMIAWWGPIIHEYYGATESIGFATCDSREWLAHRGTVGRIVFGDLRILDDEMNPVPTGQPGTIWFKLENEFAYYKDAEKTAAAHSPDGSMATVDDVGFVDSDGFLYLTDRKAFMIISGGINIYPQECENLLITHPMVADAAVFGVPNADLGEEVKAVVQLIPGLEGTPELAETLIAFCQENIAKYKCPRSIDFLSDMPRLPTGKLYKQKLKNLYWPV